MTFAEALEALLDRRDLSDPVGQALIDGVRVLARAEKIPRRHQEDAVGAAVLFLIRKGSDIQGKSVGERVNYLKAVLKTQASRLRKGERSMLKVPVKNMEDASEEEGVTPLDLVGGVDPIHLAQSLEDDRTILQRALRAVVESQPERFRDQLYRDWSEVEELARGEITMDVILERELGAEWRALPQAKAVTARNRTQQRHSRIRRSVEQELRTGGQQGRYSKEDQEVAELALRSLIRCQRNPGPGSDP